MGDHRAGSTGTTATAVTDPGAPPAISTASDRATGKRVARHAAEQRTSQPYAGRRIARVAPAPVETVRSAESLGYAGRRVAGRNPVVPPPTDRVVSAGRRIARPAELVTEPTVVRPVRVAQPVVEPVVIEPVDEPRRILTIESLLAAPPMVDLVDECLAAAPVVELPSTAAAPLVGVPVVAEPVVEEPVAEVPVVTIEAADLVEPVLATHPELRVGPTGRPPGSRGGSKQPRPGGRRVASRRSRIPSLPLLAGVAVLAISAGGALQAVHPGLAGADANGRITPASALSGSSAVGSANLLGGRDAAVSRDSDRQAAADQQAKTRDAALSAIAGQAEKRASQIKLHQWVLPVTPGVYHLTARFGDYSSLWSHFHTGLDFAAPTGTPIMAVAGGTITDVGYNGAYGNRTIETLADGTELWYCHQNSFGTSVGATVQPGQVIGYVGSTGNVTGPHLHLEVHPGGGDPVDPYTALQVHGLQP